ncbi:MAG: amino acid adenylation domain-containing protein, partial [Acidobacteriota bacterium]
ALTLLVSGTLGERWGRRRTVRGTYLLVEPVLSRLDVETADDPDHAASGACREMTRRPFDLAAEPPFRALLVRLGAERHQLAMAVHHIAADGWSMEILLGELVAIYNVLRSGRAVELAESTVRYVDYASWQREHADTIVDEELGYWLDVFPTRPPVLDLPTDHLRPPIPSYRAAAEPVHLDADASRRLLELAAADGGTPFMACLALYATWVWRLSGQTELVIGSPVAGRDRVDLSELVGLFVNTLAFAVDLDGRPSFRELLRRVRSTVLGALTHQALPFDRLVDALQPERGQAHAPIVQVMLTVQAAQPGGPVFEGLAIEPVEQVPEALEVDWTLNLAETEDGFVGGLTYATDLFDPASIRDALGGLERLVSAVVDEPDRPIDELDVLTLPARHELLYALAPGPAKRPAPDSPLDAIDARAVRYPTAPAVRGVGLDGSIRAYDYGELMTASRRLARQLVVHGVRPETRVGVAMPRSPELLVTLLAVLQAGGVWLPLDRDYPEERLRWLVTDGLVDQACSLLLTDEPSHWRRIVGLNDGDQEPTAVVDIAALLRREDPSAGRVTLPRRLARHAAYVLYTSGTTGRPTGVVVEHGSLARQLDWIQADLPLGAEDVLLQRTTVQFDVSMEEMLWPLMAGARIELAPPDIDAWQSVDLMAELGVTLVETVPALLRTWLDVPGFDRLERLRTIHCGGEEMPAELVRRFHERASRRPAGWPVLRLFNMYGPTETTITAFGGRVAASDDRSPPIDERPPLGRPVSDIRALVLDRELGLVPRGAYGELCLGGEQVARGYLGRPAATAERFVPHPFGPPGGRLYRTGDRVRWRRDGRLDFAGRLDDQIELRGFRIEPGEVEAALRELAEVADGAVGLATVDGVRRLVAWVVAADGVDRKGFRDRSREAVARRLPAHMVPSIWMVLDELPRLPTGKLARRALPSPDVEQTAYLAPRNPLERSVVETFEAVLGRSGIGVRDDFFRLGGQSLLAARVVARLRRDVVVELSVGELLDASTPEALADLLRQRVEGDQAVRPALVRRPAEAPRELSFAQERLWFLDRLRPGGCAFNMPIALDLRGALDVDALERALTEIVERHTVLRGRLIAGDDGPRVDIGPGLDGLSCQDLSRASDATVDQWVRTVARRPFRLSEDVLIRAELARLADDDDAESRYVLVVVTHHSASDGWSHDIFLQELMTLYEAYVDGRPSPLPPLAVDYADFAEWQRGWLVDDALDRQLDYWRSRLQDVPLLDLPFDRPRGTTQGEAGGWVGIALEPRLVRGLRRLAGDHGATLFMAVLACWQATLYRL